MNLMDTLLDEFHDDEKFNELNEREVAAWLEVCSLCFLSFFSVHHKSDEDFMIEMFAFNCL